MISRDKTIYFEPRASLSSEEGAQFVFQDDGRLIVSVAEEKAVDSYNQSFECTLTMTPEQARELRGWLNKVIPGDDQTMSVTPKEG